MWEVLAPIVRWPLYSPLRFIAVVVGVLVAVFLVGEVNDEGAAPAAAVVVSATPEAVPGSPSSTSSGETSSPSTTAGEAASADATDDLSVDPAADNPGAAAADAAAAFVAAWARPDLDPEAWAGNVRPLVTSDLWTTGLSMTDPASTPEVTVRGEPRQIAINAEEAVFDVPTTGDWVRVHAVPGPDGATWLVSSVEPVS
ncbi:hypothetical protein M1843_15840 [Isoptericola sp. 4D.3]|uniref:SH3 domain-containing protein n=1 Tax=Isoptericola peretonis TaxID=2918523 RepID=A0ABT0J6W9_9MICO|nr:hypothetical protein [Isoptericola sp. 4D.3]